MWILLSVFCLKVIKLNVEMTESSFLPILLLYNYEVTGDSSWCDW